MLLDNWLAQRAETCPDRAALIAGARTIDYATLEAEAVSAARRLAGKGVRRDSVVAITMPAGIEFAVALHALMKLGAVAVPLDRRLGEAERRRALGDGQSALTLSSPEDLEGAEADLPLLGEIDLDATCTRVLTSGTAGSPRPVPLTYGNHLWSAVGSAFNLGVDPGDRWLCCAPSRTSRASRSCCARPSTAPPRSSTTDSTSTGSPSRCSVTRSRSSRW